jgi:hypothetical protein
MLKFKRLLFLLFVLSFLSINVGFSDVKYNSTYNNITVDPNWWCKGLDATFKIYDETQFNNESFKENLCSEGENPEDDNCNVFTNITGDYKLYSGPIDSLPVLSEGQIKDSQISYNFEEVNDYLVEIIPDGEYNQLNTRLSILACSKSSVLINKTIKKEHDNYVLNFKFINLRKIDENLIKITFVNDSSLSFSRADLENLSTYKKDVFLINFENSNFENYSLSLENLDFDRETNLYIFDSEFKVFKSFKNISNKSIDILNNDNIKNFYLVIFSKIYKDLSSNLEQNDNYDESNSNEIADDKVNSNDNNVNESNLEVKEENLVNNNLDEDENIDTQKSLSENNENINNSSSFGNYTLLIIIVVLVLVLILFLVLKSSKNKKEDDFKKTEEVQVLSSYEQALNRTKEYINDYKESYSKDQIYRALKLANIPDDIIDKAFEEVYNK